MPTLMVTRTQIARRYRGPRWPFTINWDSPLSEGLVDHWPFHPATGAKNIVDPRFDGTLQSNPARAKMRRGLIGYKGDGSADFIFTPTYSKLNPVDTNNYTAGTVMIWGNVKASASNAALISNNYNNQNYQGPFMLQRNASDTSCTFWSADRNVTGTPNADISHFAGVIYAGAGGIELYIDGVSAGTNAGIPGTFNNGAGIEFLRRTRAGPQYMTGNVSFCSIYTRSCTAAQVAMAADPQTMWDIYWEYGKNTYFFPAAAGAAAQFPGSGRIGGRLSDRWGRRVA